MIFAQHGSTLFNKSELTLTLSHASTFCLNISTSSCQTASKSFMDKLARPFYFNHGSYTALTTGNEKLPWMICFELLYSCYFCDTFRNPPMSRISRNQGFRSGFSQSICLTRAAKRSCTVVAHFLPANLPYLGEIKMQRFA